MTTRGIVSSISKTEGDLQRPRYGYATRARQLWQRPADTASGEERAVVRRGHRAPHDRRHDAAKGGRARRRRHGVDGAALGGRREERRGGDAGAGLHPRSSRARQDPAPIRRAPAHAAGAALFSRASATAARHAAAGESPAASFAWNAATSTSVAKASAGQRPSTSVETPAAADDQAIGSIAFPTPAAPNPSPSGITTTRACAVSP